MPKSVFIDKKILRDEIFFDKKDKVVINFNSGLNKLKSKSVVTIDSYMKDEYKTQEAVRLYLYLGLLKIQDKKREELILKSILDKRITIIEDNEQSEEIIDKDNEQSSIE